MLVLTRKPGHMLKIGENIEVIVLQSSFNSVRISINAPNNVNILREEVCLRNLSNNKNWDCSIKKWALNKYP